MKFPHMDDKPNSFPHIANVDVFKYENEFDYERYDATQMKLCICTVPWDMGEAHIGNRTISGIGNVVYFNDENARDAWFSAIPDDKCYRFETKYKELHSTQTIDVPIPYDICAKYNYVTVEYNLFANDNSPVMYEDDTGIAKWFWFIREVEFISPNTTRLHIMLDAWQTFIYGFDITNMILERGHAPMFAMPASDYLQNPIENCTGLLTEDVNFGDAKQVKHTDVHVFNGENMYACIATTADPRSSNWGSKATGNWKVPTSAHYTIQGAPSTLVFCLPAADLNALLSDIDANYPQFKQTIQAIWFMSADLLSLSFEFTFAGHTCYIPNASGKRVDFLQLDKSVFNYDAKYADIAKLYTNPYAHIEIIDETGAVTQIAVEDTNGKIDIYESVNLVWPFVKLDAHLMGVSGSDNVSISFANVHAKSFSFSGRWYDYLYTWDVPTFAVVLSPAKEYDYATDFDRKQRVVDYTTAYQNENAIALTEKTNADASNATTKANADASASTAHANAYLSANASKNNADASADLIVDNTQLTTAANTSTATESNTTADRAYNIVSSYNFDVYDSDNAITTATANAQIQAQEEQAAISAASGAASGIVGAIASAATGNIAGAVTSAISGTIGAASTLASSNVAVHLSAAEAQIAILNNGYHAEAATEKSKDDKDNQKAATTQYATIQNTLATGQAANSAATAKANALRSQTAEKAIADNAESTTKANALANYTTTGANIGRSYDTQTDNADRTRQRAISAIENDIAQAALRAPEIFGAFENGSNATTKPMALFASIVTQSKAAIAAAGDEFLRYGYQYDMQWPFDGQWNIGKYFTYWKLRDFWVSNLNTPDMYADSLRFFLFGGVTVWRNPDDIGKRTIYENFN